MDSPSDLWIVLIIAGAIILDSFYEKILFFGEKVSLFFYGVLNNYLFQIIISIIVLTIILIIAKAIFSRIKRKLNFIAKERKWFREFMQDDFKELGEAKLKEKLREIEFGDRLKRYPELMIKKRQIRNCLINLDVEKKLESLEYRKIILQKDIHKLEEEKERLREKEFYEESKIKQKLKIFENYVFDKARLNPKEVKVLLKEDYKQVNEYCVLQKKNITTLVKPPMKHSTTHAFLVWSVRKLLESFDEVNEIQEFETKDADLVFSVGSKVFAIEVETGSLLRKKKQLNQKINFLNFKYGKNWLIVVSHRKFVKKYRKFGRCTQRKWVCEELRKMLKI